MHVPARSMSVGANIATYEAQHIIHQLCDIWFLHCYVQSIGYQCQQLLYFLCNTRHRDCAWRTPSSPLPSPEVVQHGADFLHCRSTFDFQQNIGSSHQAVALIFPFYMLHHLLTINPSLSPSSASNASPSITEQISTRSRDLEPGL